MSDNKKDKNSSNPQARASHKLQKLQREEHQYRSRAEALVVANYWAISRSEDAAQEANYQAFLTQSGDSNISDSIETNQWLWQLVPYRPPQKPGQQSGHRHMLPGARRPSAPSKSIHSVASETVNLLLDNWTSGTRKSEDMGNGRSSSHRADKRTESENGDVCSDSGESEDERSTLSLDENLGVGLSVSSEKKGRSNERISSGDKDTEQKPAAGASTGEELTDRAEIRTVESKPPSSHNPSPKAIAVPPPFSGHKSQIRTEDTRHSVISHTSPDPLETESALTGAQASPIVKTLSVSNEYLNSEEDTSDQVNPSDSARVVTERRRSRRNPRRSPKSGHRSSRSAHSDSMATPKHHPARYEANPGFGPSAKFPGPPLTQHRPVHLAASLPYQTQFPPFPDPPGPSLVRAPSQEPHVPSKPAEQIERLKKLVVEHIARETASKEAAKAAVAQERSAKAVLKAEREREEVELQERAKKQAEEEARKQNEKRQALSLKDAIGRKFRFPFHQSKTWDVS